MTAHVLLRARRLQLRLAVWYLKTTPATFVNALVLIRTSPWTGPPLSPVPTAPDMAKPPLLSPERVWNFFCYTA